MKRILIIIALLLIMMPFYGQLLQTTITEKFDGNPPVTFTSIPTTGAWSTHTAFFVSPPNSYRSRVPNFVGDTTILETPTYDLTLYTYVQLRFWHICKVSPRDKVSIEYRFNNTTTWIPIPYDAYFGHASNYGATGFNANSYAEWQGNDSIVQPSSSWWREEIFDITPNVNNSLVKFRFVLIHGSVPNTQVSYGWLLDNFEIRAANYEIKDPVVQFTGSYPKDTVFTTGPWEINAKVATRTAARIEQPYLKYTVNLNGTVTGSDSILMTNVAGDSLWKAVVPQFVAGTKIIYSITGRDTNGNNLTISNNYYIKPPSASGGTLNDIIIGTGTDRIYGPVSGFYGYERYVSLYKPEDGLKGGEIFNLSWNNPDVSRTIPTKVYLKEVTVNELATTSALIWNDLILGATKVYDGSFSFTASTPWVSVPLSTPFSYTGSGNLMVLVECNIGGYGGSSAQWAYSVGTNPNTHAYLRKDNSIDDALTFNANSSSASRNANRPNIRFEIQSRTDTVSVALKSINLAKQIFTSPTTNVPVEITFKNVGIQNLSTLTINWSINGVLQTPAITWTGNLPWDFNTNYVIGSYTPRMEMYDTIQVWINNPNGKADPVTSDDTLVAYIYGLSGIDASFIMPLYNDTVFHTGPYTVTAKLTSRTSVTIPTPVKLKYTITYGGTTVYDSVVMISKGGDIWEGIIPEQAYKSNITYSISLLDSLGNMVIIDSYFYVKRFTSGEIVFTKGTTTGEKFPFNFQYGHGLSMYLYTGDEINNLCEVIIDTLSFRVRTARSFTKNIKIWIKTIDASKTGWSSTTDNLDWSVHTGDATMVYDGDYSFDNTGWMDIPLQNTFTYSSGNLVVLCEAYYGGSGITTYPEFYYSSGNTNKHWYKQKDTNPIDQSTALTINSNRADIKFKVSSVPLVANSAALTKIVSPVTLATSGTPTPIVVRLKNIGEDTLKTATLYWEVNGLQQSIPWTGMIGEGFSVDVPVANYIPSLGKYDTLKIWVSLPNGVIDPNVKDDTVTAYIFGCGTLNSTGNYIVGTGSGSNFLTLGEAFNFFKLCQPQGNIKLTLQDGIYTDPVDFASIAEYRSANDTISVVSISGNPANVVIKPSTTAITVGSNNFFVKNVTLESINGIAFAKPCKNISITNIVIKMPKSLSAAGYGIRTLSDSTTLENVLVKNCTIEGGRYGIVFTGKQQAINKNILIDSNIFTDQRSFGCLLGYSGIQSISYNSIKSIGAYIDYSEWGGIAMQYGKAKTLIANNKIHVPTSNAEFEVGIYLYHNDSVVNVVNNEINMHLSSSGTYYSFYESYGIFDVNPQGDQILHNSIRMTSVSGIYNYPTGMIYQLTSSDSIVVQNNNILAMGGDAYAVYLSSYNTALQTNYKWSGNNYYSNILGYAGNNKNDLIAWKQEFTTDNSISVRPYYVDSTVNLELKDYIPFLTNPISTVTHDINGRLRNSNKTAIGAYEILLSPNQSLILESINWKKELVDNEIQSVEVSVLNLSAQPASSITFMWEKDGQLQPSYTWIPSVPLAALESANVKIDEFRISADHNVRIWATVNEHADTVSAYSEIKPLAEFVSPFIQDIIHTLSFDVYTRIHTFTGAPIVNPRMNLKTIVNASVVLYDTIDMVSQDGLWVTHVPQQYYGSKVIYSVAVSDTIGNNILLMDSTHIEFSAFGKNDTVIIGTGVSTTLYNPYYYNYDFSWSRNYYLDYEIDRGRAGGYINSISFYNTSTNTSNVDNISFYLKAVTDSIVSNGYINPLTDGATLVWGSATSSTSGAGWITFALNAPFYLPPNMNLLVYCDNYDGSYSNNGSVTWQYTVQNKNMSIYAYADASFPSSYTGNTIANRPNMKLILSSISEPYSGNNLSLSSIISPVNVFGEICSADSSSVEVSITNMGENDYDFTQDPIDLYLELQDPVLNYYTEQVHINTGGLESGKSMTVEIMSSLDIRHPGRYDIKTWLFSNIDQIPYDDTIISQFISGRISLPVDEDFSNGISPLVFVTTGSNSSYQWEAIPQGTGVDTVVKPVFGTKMLSFTGTHGASASLSVRQLELQGATQPTLEFWYFHDTVETDDYLSIRITQDGGATQPKPLISINKQDAAYGWKHYEIDLSSYTTGTCISILFEAMVMSANTTVQYVDRIRITSLQDVAVVDIITSELDVCDLKDKVWKVILGNGTPQRINFNTQPTEIQLDIVHNSVAYSFTHQLTSGILEGNSLDTFKLAEDFDFEKGIYQATAFLTVPLDNNPSNDTYTTSIEINPKLKIDIQKLSGQGNALAGYKHHQVVTIENTGNMDLSNIDLTLTVDSDKKDGEEYHFSRTKTTGKNLLPGQTDIITFDDPYIVPWASVYTVEVRGSLTCDSGILDITVSVQEVVDIDDLSVGITNPVDNGAIDMVDSLMQVSIEVKNRNVGTSYDEGDVKVWLLITDTNGVGKQKIERELPRIAGVTSILYTFDEKYTVPKLSEYYLTVFIQNKDSYADNDTVRMLRQTNHVGVSISNLKGVSFTLEQNIPNPAKDNTLINYSIPQDGEILFHVYSVSGQMLHSQKETVILGDHQIELNISDYASGIYFYSMEYQGQRIVKRMSIRR